MNYKKIITMLIWVILLLMHGVSLYAQPREPDPNTGNYRWNKLGGLMDGNLVRTVFENHGEIAHYGWKYSGEWPKGSGHLYIDGVAVVVQAECVSEDGDTIHPLEINYREDVEEDAIGRVLGWHPVPGYLNYYQDSPAMSDDPESWPDFWPDKPLDWGGYWNGYFGKGVKNADLETYYVMDDDFDTRWNFYPDSTDTTRRGLGLEVAVRGFQWSHVLAEDCIFWHFAITNEGTYDYENVIFAFYVDWGVGQNMPNPGGSDDCGSYYLDIDLAYAWDIDNTGQGGWESNVAGFAFLESPGNPHDTLDNDNDGLLNETREGGHGVWENSSCGYYKQDGELSERAREIDSLIYRWHWSGDEDGDWDAFTDINDNGIWDPDEPLNDDLGADGIGPIDEAYDGPDEGQGDGIPTQGESDFDQTDKDEADQIGLTGFKIFTVHEDGHKPEEGEEVWELLSELVPPTEQQQLLGVNLAMWFASGTFPLPPGETQRFSMALLFGEDIDDLRRNKKTVQSIYNANYNFSRPPDKPKLKAVSGDGKVILSWDDKAEDSYDRYLQEHDFEGYRIYRSTEPSFLEARLITDAYGNPIFREPIAQFDKKNGLRGPHLIDVYGAKFNLGDDTGLRHTFIDSNVNNGQTYYYAVVSYDRGYIAYDTVWYDTLSVNPLEIDTNGIISFDEDGNPIGIAPTECTSTLYINERGETKTDVNTAAVTPNAPAAGYHPPIAHIKHQGPGTGDIDVVIFDSESVKDSTVYKIIFSDTSYLNLDMYPTYTIIRDTLPNDTLSPPETLIVDMNLRGADDESMIFGGLVFQFHNDTAAIIDDSLSGWLTQQNNHEIKVGFNPAFSSEDDPLLNVNSPYPADYKIIFSDTIIDKSKRLFGSWTAIPTYFSIWNVTGNDSLKQPFIFWDDDGDSKFTSGDTVIILAENPRTLVGYNTTWELRLKGPPLVYDTTYIGGDTIVDIYHIEDPIPPQPGDVYFLKTTHPFRGDWLNNEGDTIPGDIFEVVIRSEYLSDEDAKKELDKIAVVPNPYVVAASWEPPNPYAFGRGVRKIDFIHLPQKCTIRIYTLRGNLVKTIEHNSLYGSESWDLVSKDGMDVAYGLYIYHVEAPGIGEHVGKFAVIK